MITVTGQPTFDDYLRAQRHHGRLRALLIVGILGALAILVWLTSRSIIFPAFVVLYVILLRPLATAGDLTTRPVLSEGS